MCNPAPTANGLVGNTDSEMKTFPTGKHVQVGFELQQSLAPLAEIVAVGNAECNQRRKGPRHVFTQLEVL